MDKSGRGYCFMGYQETITFILEMIGTIAFAASGALVGSEQKMDIFGVSVLGVITACLLYTSPSPRDA